MPTDLLVPNRKRWTIRELLVVRVSNEELRRVICNVDEMFGISKAYIFRQGDQRRAVKDGINRTKHLACEIKNISHKNIYIYCAVVLYFTYVRYFRLYAKLFK